MTTTTIPATPAFPGDLWAFADQAPEPVTGPIRIGNGTRRHPNRPGRWGTAVVVLVLSFLVGAALALPATAAHAATAPRHSSLWWDTQTCRAFGTWERHQTWPRFGVVVRDSRHADTYLRVDVGLLDRAEVKHAPRNVRAELETFVWTDCHTNGD